MVPLELSGQIPPCANFYIRLQGLRLARPQASALSYANEAIPRGPCAAPISVCRSFSELAEAQLLLPKLYGFTDSDPPGTLKYFIPRHSSEGAEARGWRRSRKEFREVQKLALLVDRVIAMRGTLTVLATLCRTTPSRSYNRDDLRSVCYFDEFSLLMSPYTQDVFLRFQNLRRLRPTYL